MKKRFGGISTVTASGGMLLLASVLLPCPAHARQAYTVMQDQDARLTQPKTALERRVTVALKNVSLGQALSVVDKEARLNLVYSDRLLPLDRKVSISMTNTPASTVLRELLQGTGVVARLSESGQVVLATQSVTPQQAGSITGRVTDSASGEGLGGVAVTIQGTKLSVLTQSKGDYTVQNVPAGEYTVTFKLLGYSQVSRTVRIENEKRTVLNVAFKQSASILSGVVTTATGERRKVEVGHSIATINVDSLRNVMPIQSVADILESRVPGMTVQRTSGTPGDPARIRLRGTGSPLENNDPVIVIDGVRQYSGQSDARNVTGSGITGGADTRKYATTSPLDQINPNSIEKIEVLKGPSASALYGSDAANGVIVITTKKGQAGPPQWDFGGNIGLTQPLSAWPISRYQWVTPLHGGPPTLCIGFCGDSQIDSVIMFQALNNPRLTPLGRGNTSELSGGVSGGSQTMTYSFNANTMRERGVLKLPKIEEERYLRFQNEPAPGWMRRPDLLERREINANINVIFSPKLNLSFIPTLTQETQRRTSMSSSVNGAIEQLQRTWIDLSQLDERPILGNPYERVVNNKVTTRNNLAINAIPFWWLPINATLGAGSTVGNLEASIEPGLLTTSESGGMWRGETNTSNTMSAYVRTNIPEIRRIRTSLGFNYDLQRTDDRTGVLVGIPEGIPDPTVGQQDTVRHFTSEQAIFGWHVQPQIALSNRFFMSPGFRLDNNGLSGVNAKLNGLPRMDFSWVVSDEPFFPGRGFIDQLRLRTAVGVSGEQPTQGDLYRLYTRRNLTAPEYGDILELDNLGNTRLRPERVTEYEFGVDFDVWQNRIGVELTHARKSRKDAIVPNSIAGSIDGGDELKTNVGDLEDASTEMTLRMQLVERSSIAMGFDANFTRSTSNVRRLNEAGSLDVGTVRYVVGYPTAGVWMRPVVGYADQDGDGWLSFSELVLGASPEFIGTQQPSLEMAVFPRISFLKGLLNLTAGISHVSGQLQTFQAANAVYSDLLQGSYPFLSSVVFGPEGFDRQAAYLGVNIGGTGVGYTQKVDMTRLQFVSLQMAVNSKMARLVKARSASIALQGRNLGLWTNYIGADPNVNGIATGHGQVDNGQQPEPRQWQLSIRMWY